MRSDVHPELGKELEALLALGFRHENAIAKILGTIDHLFVEAPRDTDIPSNWALLPYADAGVSRSLDLRCIDSNDGLITVIVAIREDVFYVLSANRATKQGRRIAVKAAATRIDDLSWANPD
jgi:hypothetical protein